MYPKRKAFPTMVSAKSEFHSQKPQVFRDLITPFGDKKLEMFARIVPEGWDVWGMKNKKKVKEVMDTCARKVQDRKLPMKLIDAEFSFDRSKIIFYFTAEGRVDFRDLVRDLANSFKTRIELKQIGVRDEAKMLGGLGPCGRALCCATGARR